MPTVEYCLANCVVYPFELEDGTRMGERERKKPGLRKMFAYFTSIIPFIFYANRHTPIVYVKRISNGSRAHTRTVPGARAEEII